MNPKHITTGSASLSHISLSINIAGSIHTNCAFFPSHTKHSPIQTFPGIQSQIELGGGSGVKVANILEDPVVNADKTCIKPGQRSVVVRGSGFYPLLRYDVPDVVIDGISPSKYSIQVRLRAGAIGVSFAGAEIERVGNVVRGGRGTG